MLKTSPPTAFPVHIYKRLFAIAVKDKKPWRRVKRKRSREGRSYVIDSKGAMSFGGRVFKQDRSEC